MPKLLPGWEGEREKTGEASQEQSQWGSRGKEGLHVSVKLVTGSG